MKLPKKLVNKILRLSELAKTQRLLNLEVINELSKRGIDTECGEFEDLWGHVEGDCCANYLIEAIDADELLKKEKI